MPVHHSMFVFRDTLQFSDPSLYALLHRNADVLQPTGVRTSLCWASFQGKKRGGKKKEEGGMSSSLNSGGFKLSE